MIPLLLFLLVGAGLFLLFSPVYYIGAALLAAAAFVSRFYTARDEDRFLSVLATLAILGVAAAIVEDFIGRFLLS